MPDPGPPWPATLGWLGRGLGCLPCCAAEPTPAADVRLRRVLRDALLGTRFTDLDHRGTGWLSFGDFEQCFGSVAGMAELADLYCRIRKQSPGEVTYGQYVAFQEEISGQCLRKAGDPQFLEYASLLEGVVLSCSRPDFVERLDRAGEPFPPAPGWLQQEMAREWDTPLLRPHWTYATSPVPWKEDQRRFPNWKGGYSVLDETHAGMTLEDFCAMPQAQSANLTEPEVLGLRLYTGPGYRSLNCSLRANSGRFPVTQFCIDSAIGKLAQNSAADPQPLMRGLGKPMPAKWGRMYEWYRGVQHRRLALSDPGFVSTTTDARVATGDDFGGPALFLLHTAAMLHPEDGRPYSYLSHGADVQWVSQYPSEAEVLLPSNAIFVPHLRCRHRRQPSLPSPKEFEEEKKEVKGAKEGLGERDPTVYEFRVFYPWDSTARCPLVYDNEVQTLLRCANDLLDVVYGLEMQLWQECRQGHRKFTPVADPVEEEEEEEGSAAPPAACPRAASVAHAWEPRCLEPGTQYEPDAFLSVEDLCLPAEPADPHSRCSTIELVSPQAKRHGLPDNSLRYWHPLPGTALDPEDDVGDTEAILHKPYPRAFQQTPPMATSTGAFPLSLPTAPQPASTRPVHQLSDAHRSLSMAPPHSLQGTNTVCQARIPYYTERDLAAALAKLRTRQRLNDAPAVAGGAYPLEAAVASPFHGSAWRLGLWGLVTAVLGALAGSLGVALCGAGGAAGGAAAAVSVTVSVVVVTSVVAVSVPLTVLPATPAAIPSPSPSPSPSPPAAIPSPSPSPSPSPPGGRKLPLPTYPVAGVLSALFAPMEAEIVRLQSLPEVASLLSLDLHPPHCNVSVVYPLTDPLYDSLKTHSVLTSVSWNGVVVNDSDAGLGLSSCAVDYEALYFELLMMRVGNRTLYLATYQSRADGIMDYDFFALTEGGQQVMIMPTRHVRSNSQRIGPTCWDSDLLIDLYTGELTLGYETWLPAQNNTKLRLGLAVKLQGVSADLRVLVAAAPGDRLVVFLRQPHGHMVAASHGKVYSQSDVDPRSINTLLNPLNMSAYQLYTCVDSNDTFVHQACQQLLTVYRSWDAIPELQQTMVLNGEQFMAVTNHTQAGPPCTILQLYNMEL